MGTASLARGKKVVVTDSEGKKKEYSADKIILATGGRAKELPNLKIDGEKMTDKSMRVTSGTAGVFQVGKRKFARITIS